MKRTLIIGNWKMNLNVSQASLLVHRLDERIQMHRDVEIVLAPTVLALQPLSLQIDRRKFRLAAQNAFHKDEGAYTGEVSFTQLRDIIHYCIIGHSERRVYFKEDNDIIRDKVAASVRNEITPVLCIGETQHERALGETRQVLHDQIVTALANLTAVEVEKMVIAYEPVWAISTFGGILAKPHEIQREIEYIRRQVGELYGPEAAQHVRVLYGGSVDDQIARGYLELPGCDGALVGGASLNYHKFSAIVASVHRMHAERQQRGA